MTKTGKIRLLQLFGLIFPVSSFFSRFSSIFSFFFHFHGLEFIQNLNGEKITWSVTILDKDKNEILQKRYRSTNVVEFNDPTAPIGVMLCYTDDDITKIKLNQKAKISGTIIANRNIIDLFPCKIVK